MRPSLTLAAVSVGAVAALAIGCLTGCFTAESPIPDSSGGNGGNVGGNGHRTSGGAASGGSKGTSSNGGGGTTSGAGGGTTSGVGGGTTTSGGTSGGNLTCALASNGGTGAGTNTIFDCNAVPYYTGGVGNCTGQDWLGTQILDFESCAPVCGANVQAQDVNGVPISGTPQLSDETGTFHFCLPPATTFETVVTAPGYGNFYYAEIKGQLATDLPSFGMLTTTELTAFASFVSPPLSFAKGALVAFTINLDGCGGSNAVPPGWSMSLTDENGAPYPDGGYVSVYVDDTGFPNPALTATGMFGVVIIYNIDPTVAQFPTLHATNPNPNGCSVGNSRDLGFTGRIQVGPGIFSEGGLFME